MRPILKYLIIIGILPTLSCQSQSGVVNQLEESAFEQKLKEIQDHNLIDIRTREEYQQGHLAKAVMIDYHSSDFRNKISKLDKSKPLFYYCGSGVRSGNVIPLLNELGFKEVYELKVGFSGWRSANKPFVK